jgi:hypothetical protein
MLTHSVVSNMRATCRSGRPKQHRSAVPRIMPPHSEVTAAAVLLCPDFSTFGEWLVRRRRWSVWGSQQGRGGVL